VPQATIREVRNADQAGSPGRLVTAALGFAACGGGDDTTDAESLIPIEDRVVESGNLIAVVDSNSSPDYRATIEGCLPPA
jgi:hypothetical protein